jgi:hypothetical protein
MKSLTLLTACAIASLLTACSAKPVANAGADFTVNPGNTSFLDATGSSDPEGDPLTFEWTQTQGTPTTLTINADGFPTFRAPFSGNQFLTFTVTVSDGHSTDSASVIVSVGGTGNHRPVARAGNDQTVTAGSAVTLNGSGTDPDTASTLTYQWEQTAGNPAAVADATMASTTFTAPTAPGDLTYRLRVNDGTLNGFDSLVIHVQ